MASSFYDFYLNGNFEGARASLGRGEVVNQIWQYGSYENLHRAENLKCNFKALPLHAAILLALNIYIIIDIQIYNKLLFCSALSWVIVMVCPIDPSSLLFKSMPS